MKAADPKYCTRRITACLQTSPISFVAQTGSRRRLHVGKKNYGDKKGTKLFQQQRKMFCRKFGLPSVKVLQIKVRRLKLFGCSLKLLANMQPASHFTDLEKKEHKCLKRSTVCILHFAPSLHFTLSLHFTPGPQSAVLVLH